ncbi:polymerase [Kern Canyon virus]|uniref:Replicase n=3 Tax=Kern Canyon virus TaxID=380433 RepID=A0A0D3R1G9_9RHAB|nr:polymerase [Kern Canyon virus]AJR28347.1 polymerase [Kern Canyon virus]
MDSYELSDDRNLLNDDFTDEYTSFLDELSKEEGEYFESNFFQFENLNLTDYNLNSPLIADDIIGYLAKLRGEKYPPIFEKSEWEERDALMKHLKFDPWDILDPAEMHKWMGNFFKTQPNNFVLINKLLSKTFDDHQITGEVFYEFKKTWSSDIRRLSKADIPTNEKILKWGEWFIEFHHITLCLNASSPRELEVLGKTLGGRVLKKQGNTVGIRLTSSIGPVYIAGGIAYFPDNKVMLDRSFTLMVKDICVGRFNTLLGMCIRLDDRFTDEDITKLVDLYEKGDDILSTFGNSGYKAIKILEPACNLMYCEMARTYRPLIPDFPSFRQHVLMAFREFEDEHISATHFKDHILHEDSLDMITIYYGSFRHWGHPFIDYFSGLEKLHTQVNMRKDIDDNYAQSLGSDLAFIVLRKKFFEMKKWFVKKGMVAANHPFKDHIENNIWPTPKQIEDFGDNWHRLPLDKCFEIPDVIDPSLLYSDKSHSMNLDEIIDHIQTRPNEPIPTRKVLQTLLERPATNWPEFLQRINDHGLEKNAKAIGLKPKEREQKIDGRFFSLMSWDLREYFVITEYLIKTHFVPLFNGLTMADDLTTVITKLLDRTQGQGGADYENICIANHIDYEKWNNHKRYEATRYVFEVMGKFLGYPRLIEMTHLIFQECLIYFNARPDLMEIRNGMVVNATDKLVCWNGQLGGLEGLRQKGWAIVDVLTILREIKIRNTMVKTLIQGDNQVVCTLYKLNHSPSQIDLLNNLRDIHRNNAVIMEAIKRGTERLGLIINEDETMQSADFLNYGKVPIFRGRVLNLFTKRLSRIMCATNDQILSFGNIMTTVSTNCLTISHFDESPIASMLYYDFFGNLTRNVLEIHNPILKGPPSKIVSESLDDPYYKISSLYLDPSLGGVCGMALTRFMTRGFPDPVTESLSFWKYLYDNSHLEVIQNFARMAGDPPLSRATEDGLLKLLEKPSSLNIPKGLSITNLLKTEIKRSLQQSIEQIKNEVIADALDYLNHEEEHLMSFLKSVKPLFPRFLSEFRSSSFVGLVDSLVGLFQNSRTIRRSFSKRMSRDINRLTYTSEISTYSLLTRFRLACPPGIWSCSSSHADQLRLLSWGERVLGTTIPHPLEMFGSGTVKTLEGCTLCDDSENPNDFITTLAPLGLATYYDRRGPYPAYLGSKTSESTSIIQPWERETKVSLIKKALKLRGAIHWFVQPESNLAKSIFSISKGLTGEDWDKSIGGFKRTGSAIHRFSCSRQSSGGYAAINPAKLSWVLSTTDTFSIIGDKNYDFMFQPSILYAQLNTIEMLDGVCGSQTVHHHLHCKDCLREIDEPILESDWIYFHPDVSKVLDKWKPDSTEWGENKTSFELTKITAKDFHFIELSYQVGRSTGFLFGDMLLGDNRHVDDSSLFPLTIQSKVIPDTFLDGLLDGLLKAVSINVIHRRSVAKMTRPRPALIGGMIHCITEISGNPNFLNLVRKGPLFHYLSSSPHRVPPSYPINDSDLGSLVRNWMKKEFSKLERNAKGYTPKYNRICIFSDMASPEIIGPFLLSTKTLPILFKQNIGKSEAKKLRALRDESAAVRECSDDSVININPRVGVQCLEEIRHAVKVLKDIKKTSGQRIKWGKEVIGDIMSVKVEYTTSCESHNYPDTPQYRCPLISGLRLFQLATGAHYKIRTIIVRYGIIYKDFICGGDGSGGMTSALMRLNSKSRCIYNSLIEYNGISTKGARPGGPPAVEALFDGPDRCVNFSSVWEDPTDLSESTTWERFKYYIDSFHLKIDLIVLDMEVRDPLISDKIEDQVEKYGPSIISKQGSIVYKTYLSRLFKQPSVNILTKVGKYFKDVSICQTSFTSSRSSEVYVIMTTLKVRPGNQIFPRLHSVHKDRFKFAVFRSEDEEFDRAYRLMSIRTLEGVPLQLLPDLETEISSILSQHGVDDGVSVQLARVVLITGKTDPGTMIWSILGIASNNIIDITSEHLDGFHIPSDQACSSLLSLIVGIGYWISVYTKDSKLFSYLNHICDSFMIFQFRKVLVYKTKSVGEKPRYRVDWGVGIKGAISKKIFLTSKQATLGSWIRLLSRSVPFGLEYKPNPELIWKSFVKKLKWKNVKSRTGLMEMLISRNPGLGEGTVVLDKPKSIASAERD